MCVCFVSAVSTKLCSSGFKAVGGFVLSLFCVREIVRERETLLQT
jgi:hypothetical protein